MTTVAKPTAASSMIKTPAPAPAKAPVPAAASKKSRISAKTVISAVVTLAIVGAVIFAISALNKKCDPNDSSSLCKTSDAVDNVSKFLKKNGSFLIGAWIAVSAMGLAGVFIARKGRAAPEPAKSTDVSAEETKSATETSSTKEDDEEEEEEEEDDDDDDDDGDDDNTTNSGEDITPEDMDML